jgi:hypothetical protein
MFTIKFPRKKVDPKGTYKNYLLHRLIDSYPELLIAGIDNNNEYDPRGYQYVGPSEEILIVNEIDRPKGYMNVMGISNRFRKNMTRNGVNVPEFDLGTEPQKIMAMIDRLIKRQNGYKKLYDFKLPDGTPVKEYDNFIQVGFEIIPKEGTYRFLETLNKTNKKRVTTIEETLRIVVEEYLNRQ